MLPRKLHLRPPGGQLPQHQRVHRDIGYLLHHQRPDSKAHIGKAQAQDRGYDRARKGGIEKILELHVPGHMRLLDRFDAADRHC